MQLLPYYNHLIMMMSAISKRLAESFEIYFPEDESQETLTTYINALSSSSRAKLVSHHAQINIEYSILCSKIAIELEQNGPINLNAQIQEALNTAQLLEIVYRDYLNVPREIDRLRQEQNALRAWLGSAQDEISLASSSYLSKKIRETTANINLSRLFAVRLKRLLVAIAKVSDQGSVFRESILNFDANYAAPFFSHLAWLYFLPRIATNLAMIVKHTIPFEGMSEAEKNLGWQNRFFIQLNIRWPDLSNDIPWCIANFLSCFLLVGDLLTYGIIFSVIMQVYEVAQASMIYYVELKNLHQQRAEYQKLLDLALPESDDYHQFTAFLLHLDQRIDYETWRLWIPVVNTSILLLAVVISTPIFAPGFAVAGALLAVSTTIGSYEARKHHENNKPASHLFQLLNAGFFCPSRPVETNDSDLMMAPR